MHVDPSRSTPPLATPLPSPPVRGYGVVAQVLLAVVIAIDVWIIGAVNGQRSIIDRLVDGDPTVGLTDANDADHTTDIASNWGLLTFALAALAFVVWFWRARTNAGEYAPQQQRRARPWAVWAWICPVVNLWFPFQIAADATRSVHRRVPRGLTLLRFWWGAWLLAALLNRVVATRHPSTVDQLVSQTKLEIVATVVEIVAALLAIVVIATISRDLDKHRETLLRQRFS